MKIKQTVTTVFSMSLLVFSTLWFSACSNQESDSDLQAADPNALFSAMVNQCNANPSLIPNAALHNKMIAHSVGEVYWRPYSNEKHWIFAGDNYYVAQIALGQSVRTGQTVGFRIYYAPMNIWNPVLTLDVGSNICGGVIPPIGPNPPVIIVPPMPPVPPVVIVPPTLPVGTIPYRSCGGSELSDVPSCANFLGQDPQRGNITAKGQCTQGDTRAFQVIEHLSCVVQCPQPLIHWGSGRIEGLPIFNGYSSYLVQRDGRGVASVTLSSQNPNADVTGQICN